VVVEGRCSEGYFVEPTVIVGLDQSGRTNQEEIFGPVVTIMPFDTEQEAIELANANSLWFVSHCLDGKFKACSQHLASTQEWNCLGKLLALSRLCASPFGGMKQSGVGREGGLEALRFFTEAKNVCIRL